mgnify:FL=1
MQNNKIVLCFREGEPFLFNFNTKTFLELCIDYESTIVQIKEMIEEQNKRPQMNEVWNMLAKTIDGCNSYSPNKSFRTKSNINSFESRFTREINDFLSSKFERSLLKDGNYKNWLYQNSFIIRKSHFN